MMERAYQSAFVFYSCALPPIVPISGKQSGTPHWKEWRIASCGRGRLRRSELARVIPLRSDHVLYWWAYRLPKGERETESSQVLLHPRLHGGAD